MVAGKKTWKGKSNMRTRRMRIKRYGGSISRIRKRRTKKTKKTRTHQKKKKYPSAYGHVYSTECGHCINMQEDWDNLTNEVKEVNNAIELIDISENRQENVDEMNKKYHTDLKFSGFPTIFKVIQKKTPVQYYTGDRSTENMKKWLFS